VLARTLAEARLPHPVVAVFSVLNDKDWMSMMAALAPEVDRFILTNTRRALERAWNVIDVLAMPGQAGRPTWSGFRPRAGPCRRRGATVVITGSFHTVGDAMSRLQVSPTAG